MKGMCMSVNICESSVWDMFHGTLLTHNILRCIPDFENLYTPGLSHTVPSTAKHMIQKTEPLVHMHANI